MPIHRVYAHPQVEADRDRVALIRGPLVYCLEAVDQDFDLTQAALSPQAELKAEPRPTLLGGVTVLTGEMQPAGKEPAPVPFTAIPYYAWQNRKPGAMQVWIKEKK